MTREEAIKRIGDIKRNYKRMVEIMTDNEAEALDMAIESLEKEIGCEYCKFNDIDGKFDTLCMECHSNDKWVRKELNNDIYISQSPHKRGFYYRRADLPGGGYASL